MSFNIIIALFPFRYLIIWDMLYFDGKCTCSDIICPSTISYINLLLSSVYLFLIGNILPSSYHQSSEICKGALVTFYFRSKVQGIICNCSSYIVFWNHFLHSILMKIVRRTSHLMTCLKVFWYSVKPCYECNALSAQ